MIVVNSVFMGGELGSTGKVGKWRTGVQATINVRKKLNANDNFAPVMGCSKAEVVKPGQPIPEPTGFKPLYRLGTKT